MVNLAALIEAHDFCTYLLDHGGANGYVEAIVICRRAAMEGDPMDDPNGWFSTVPIALLKSTLVASDGNLQREGRRL